MSDQFQDILKEIQDNQTTITVDTITKKNIKLTPLTLSQQKRIIESVSDETLAVLFFNNVFYDILKENIIDNDIDTFDTIDRVNLTLALRMHLQDEVDLDDNTKIKISEIIEKNKDNIIDIKDRFISKDNFTFGVQRPKLGLDNKINKLLLNKYKNAKMDQNKLKNLISDLYVYEILKFVSVLRVNDKEINLHDNFTESIKLLGQIDTSLLTDVTEYINEVREAESLFTKRVDNTDNIDITPNLFIL